MEPRTIRSGMVRFEARKGEVFVMECRDHWVAASWDGMETWPLGDPRDSEQEAIDDAREAIRVGNLKAVESRALSTAVPRHQNCEPHSTARSGALRGNPL